ncbi:MAG: PAS domain-containing protein, partial [Acidiferrobacteraceae bacterium]
MVASAHGSMMTVRERIRHILSKTTLLSPFSWSVSHQKKLIGLFLLPMIFFSAMGAYQTLFHSPSLTRKLHDYNFMNSDLQGFNTTLRYLEKSPPKGGEKMSGNIQRIHGYLIHAKTLLLDIRSRQKSLPGPDRKRIITLIEQTDNLIGGIRHSPPVPPDPSYVFSLSQQTFPILLTLSRMTRSTLLISQRTNRQIVLFQVLALLMFLGLVAILLAWLEGYRKHLRNMAIYEALNVSVSGIAFLPVSMDRFDAVNRGFEELTGYRSSELIGTPDPPVDPLFGHSEIQNQIRDLIDNRIGVLSFDTHIFSRDNNQLYLHVRLEKTIFEGQTRIVATVENRTEEKKLQDELLSSRNHLLTLFRHLGDGVMELDPKGNILFLNATGERLLGYLSDELSGLPASTLFVPSGSKEETFVSPETFILSRIRHAALSGDSYETESYSLIKKNGEQMDSSLIFTPLLQGPDNTLKEIVVVFRDIGTRKRLQKKLRKSEEKYRKMIQSTPDGIVLLDPRSLQVLEANPSFADMVGIYFTERLIGKEITEFIPEIREEFQKSGLSPAETGFFDSGNIRIRRSDRTSILVSIKETVIPYEEQDAILVVIR